MALPHCFACPAPLTPGDLENFKKTPFTLKEGVDYKIEIDFKVEELAQCSEATLLP